MSETNIDNTESEESAAARPNGSRFHEKTRALSSRDMRKFLVNGPPAGLLAASAATYFPDVEFRPVQTIDELKKASRLVYHEYLKSEFISPHKNQFKFNLYQVLPSTVTFVAIYKKNRVLGTLTAVEDSPLGLPMDNLYYDELINFRLDRRRMIEFTMLAMDKEIMESGDFYLKPAVRWLLLFHLIRSIYDYARACTKVDTLVACFHPRHDSFYKLLNMRSFGDMRQYAGVKGKPAMARYTDVVEFMKEGSANTTSRLFLRDVPAPKEFSKRLRFAGNDIKELFVDHTNILASAAESKLNFIRDCYPGLDLHAIIRSKTLVSYLLESLEDEHAAGMPPVATDGIPNFPPD